jgi:hypothetical protein
MVEGPAKTPTMDCEHGPMEGDVQTGDLIDVSVALGFVSALTISLQNVGVKLALSPLDGNIVRPGHCLVVRGGIGLFVMSCAGGEAAALD